MNKEPIALYIFRFILGFGLFAFMCMLYWSSLLIENDLRILRSEVAQLKSDVIQSIIKERNQVQETIKDAIACATTASLVQPLKNTSSSHSFEQPSFNLNDKSSGKIKLATRSTIDPKIPNMLKEDLFYSVTLPKLLGENFIPSGTQHTAVVTKPNNLHPFSNWSQISAWNDLCNVTVAQNEFGKYETYAPNMAIKVEERINSKTGIPEFWVHLRDNVFWRPIKPEFFSDGLQLAPHFLGKNQVTAEDFKFYLDAIMNPYVQEPAAVALRTFYAALQEIEIVDKLTFIVRWKFKLVEGSNGKEVPKIKYIAKGLTSGLKPLASFVYKHFPDGRKIIDDDSAPDTYRTNSVWAQNFAEHWAKNVIVSCGAWSFDGMTDRQIKFIRNPDFYFPIAALSSAIEVGFKASPDNVWQDFKSNHLDTYVLPPDQVLELADFLKSDQYKQQAAKGYAINRLDYVARSYAYIGWNEAKPYFKSKKVRQAMTMAIDRNRIIQQNLNGMGIETTGTFYRFSPSYDASIQPWPFDPEKARRLLEQEGWFDSDGDGIIDKLIDGKRVPFKFSLTYFVKNPTAKSVCEYVATALKEIGIVCNLNGVDLADLSAAFDDKSFDALYLAWVLGSPPEDPRQLWYSSGAKEKGSSNAVGFANAEIDAIVDKLEYEYDPKKRLELYHRFHAIINDEQPYTFLYTPKVALLYREYVQNVFIPADRQELIPGANIAEPVSSIFRLKMKSQ